MSNCETKLLDWRSFHTFERENKLFELKNKDGLPIWDIVRFDVYYCLLIDKDKVAVNAVSTQRSFAKNLWLNAIYLVKLILFFFVGKYKYLMVTNARNKTADNKFFDQNLDDVLREVHKASFILETFETKQSNYLYQQSNYYNVNLIRRIALKCYKVHDYSSLLNLINTEFGSCPALNNQYLNSLINGFKFDYTFYKRIIKKKGVKAVFVTQNGIQKGLFAAARDLGIPAIEHQHGLIERAHIAYSYDAEIIYPPLSLNLPAYFFSFSDYWTKTLFYPVKEIIPIGNSAFYKSLIKPTVEKKGEGLTVVSANIYGERLKELILDYLKLDSHTIVYFKLHPNQWKEASYYKAAFREFNNVKVITSEMSMGQLVQETKGTLVIKSTAIYEALQAQRTGIIYSVDGAMTTEDVGDLKNIHFVSDAVQLKRVVDKGEVTEKYEEGYFFKNFNASMFSDFMNKINI